MTYGAIAGYYGGMADRVIYLEDGGIVKVQHNAEKLQAHDLSW